MEPAYEHSFRGDETLGGGRNTTFVSLFGRARLVRKDHFVRAGPRHFFGGRTRVRDPR
jgi:hypothetical protein